MPFRFPAPRSLASAIDSHDNGFNLVRLVCALMVVVFHAWQLAPVGAGRDPVSAWMFPVTDLGSIAVAVFFIISGIFVTQSWVRDPHGLRFGARRVARVVPGLFVCLLLTTVLAVGLFSVQGWAGLGARAPWYYIFDNTVVHGLRYLFGPESKRIEGVLGGMDLNGPLWTLYWEGRMYVMVALLGMAAVLPLRTWLRACALFLLLAAVAFPEVLSGYVWEVRLWSMFLVGMLLQTLAPSARIGPLHVLCAAALLGLNWTRNLAQQGQGPTWFGLALVLGALALWLGTRPMRALGHLRRHDYSYGVYIYHWPILLMLRAVLPGSTPALLLVAGLAVVLPVAALSWHLVEQPALRWTRRQLRPRRHEAKPPH